MIGRSFNAGWRRLKSAAFDLRGNSTAGRAVIDWIAATGVRHLNVSRAHPDQGRNAKLTALPEGLSLEGLAEVFRRARSGGTRARLASTWRPWDGVLGPPPSKEAGVTPP